MSKEKYVHEGVEVVMTGRQAHRTIVQPGGGKRILVLVEIKPFNDSFDTLKWVDPAHLYVIVDKNEE